MRITARNTRRRGSRSRTGPYALDEALPLVQKIKFAKFDETVALSIRLGVDPKHADQMVRGTVVLPHGLGKSKRVLVIAGADKQKEAEEAGADVVGGEELVEKIAGGWIDFDAVVATPDMMRVVGKLGKVLGPRGLMPNPKTGTVTPNVAQAVKEIKAGKVEFRVDKTGIVHAPVGKTSFPSQNLIDNASALLDSIVKAKPPAAKGKYLRSITVSSTMGPGVKIDEAASRRGEDVVSQTVRGTKRSRPGRGPGQQRRMAVTRADKETELQMLEGVFQDADAAILIDYKGINVPQVTELRAQLRKAQGRLQGGQEHARQARAEGHRLRAARRALRGHDRGGLHRRAIRWRWPRR